MNGAMYVCVCFNFDLLITCVKPHLSDDSFKERSKEILKSRCWVVDFLILDLLLTNSMSIRRSNVAF